MLTLTHSATLAVLETPVVSSTFVSLDTRCLMEASRDIALTDGHAALWQPVGSVATERHFAGVHHVCYS